MAVTPVPDVAVPTSALVAVTAVTGPWTIDSLQMHLSQRIEGLDGQLSARIDQLAAANGLSFHHVEEMVAQAVAVINTQFQAVKDAREAVLLEREKLYAERFAAADLRYQQRFDAQQEALKIALTGVETSLLARLNAVREETAAALAAVSKADVAHMAHMAEIDLRYQQRFDAQEVAVSVALSHVDKEFHEHLTSVREETQAALLAADKAIGKSEAATEKRFESVNEFRSQLADQSATFMPRAESISRHDRNGEHVAAIEKVISELRERTQLQTASFMPRAETEQRTAAAVEKIEALDARTATALAQVNQRLDITQGQSGGSQRVQGLIFSVIAAAVGLIGITVAIISNAG